MNKRIIILIIIIPVILLNSCRSDGPSGMDITGLWWGYVDAAEGWTDGPVVFEITEGGAFKMGDVNDEVIYDEAINQNFTWSLNDNYFTVTAWAYLYFSEFAYSLSETGDTLTLVLIRRNFFNETYDEIDAGSRIVLTRDDINSFTDYFNGNVDLYSSY